MKKLLLALTLAILSVAPALAQTFNYGTGNIASNPAGFNTAGTFTGYSITGNDLTVNASASINMPVGTYNFVNVTINTGATVTITGNTGPFIIRCTGTFTNNGDIRGIGGNGGNASGVTAGVASTGVGGGAAGGIGGAGGSNGTSTTASGTSFGTSSGRGLFGCSPTATRPSWAGPGGGGGSYGAAGFAGGNGSGQSTGCTSGGAAGTVYGNASLTLQVGAGAGFFSPGATAAGDRWILAGSGGAGGHGTQSILASARAAGGGGGAGGAAIQIVANSVSIGSGAWIRARGGNGGNGSVSSGGTAGGGGGGGGSGGTINIQYMSSYTNSGTLQVSGGIGGGQGFGTTGTGGSGGNGGSGRTLVEQDIILCTQPTINAGAITGSNITATTADISFTRGNGSAGVIVLARAGSAVNASPTSGNSYTANATFGSGSQIGTGNYVVYIGTGNGINTAMTTSVAGLTGGTTYHFSAFEYNTTGTCYTSTGGLGSFTTSNCSGAPPTATAVASPTAICSGASSNLSLTGLSQVYTYQWQISNSNSPFSWSDISGANNATYSTGALTATRYYRCNVTCLGNTTASTPVTVTVNPLPNVTVTPNTSICSGGSGTSLVAGGASTYAWSPATGLSATTGSTVTANPTTTQIYTVTGTDANSCQNTANVTVTVNLANLSVTPTVANIGIGQSTVFTASATSANGTVNFTWSPATGLSSTTGASVTATPLTTTTYTVTASDGICSRSTTVTVFVSSGTPGSVSCGYTFSATTQTYTAISGGTSLGAAGNNNYSIDLTSQSFIFDYNGRQYSRLGVNGNGYIWFGNTSPTASTTTPISTTTAYDGAIAVFGSALTSGTVSYVLTGTSPNRVLTIQWGNALTNGSCLNAQIKLYENNPGNANSNRIQLILQSQALCLTNNSSASQIGLRGASNSDFNNRAQASGNITAVSTTAGTLNTSTVNMNAATYINANILWTYTPNIETPTISPSTTQTLCQGETATALTANTTVVSPTYQWQTYTYPPSNTNIGGEINASYSPSTATVGNTYYVVRVTNGTGCSRTSSAVAVIVNSCGPLVWNGSVSTDWNNPLNWTPNNIPTSGNDIEIPNVANDPDLSTGANGSCKSVDISSGATLSIASGKTIDVKGNWTGVANTVSGAGKLIFSGTTAQTISGGATISNWQINNSTGVSISSGPATVKVTNSLELKAGTLTTNNNFISGSTVAATAYIDDFSSGFTGSISGNVKVQRYIGLGASGFRYIGTPVNTGAGVMALSGLSGFTAAGIPGQIIPLPTCDANNVALNSPYGNFMYWNENGPFNVAGCKQSGWYFQTSGNMIVAKGYGAKLSPGNTLTYTGNINTGNINGGTLANTTAEGNGWHLVSNPYPSAMAISNIDANPNNNMPSGFDGQIQFFQASGAYTGTYQAYNVGVQTAPIALGQGFWIRATTSGNWNLNNNYRTTNNPTYYNAQSPVEHHLNINVSGNGFMDQTDINFVAAANTGVDFYDANKWTSSNGVPTLYSLTGNEMLAINSVPSLTETVAIPVGFKPGANGEFTFNFNDLATFPASAMVYLEDTKTGSMVNLRNTNNYNFVATVNDEENRFILHFNPGVVATVTDNSCEQTGSISYTQPGNTTWDSYDVKDNNGNIYAQGTNFNGTLTLTNLQPQEYILTLNHTSGYTAQLFTTVNGNSITGISAVANVSANDVLVNEVVGFTATANNATQYTWNFGDGNTATGLSTTHSFAEEGVYTISLTATNENCAATATKTITVNRATGITLNNADNLTIHGNGNRIVVEYNQWGGDKADLFMYNALGQRVESLTGVSTLKGRTEFEIENLKPGYYFIQIASDGKVAGKKLLLGY